MKIIPISKTENYRVKAIVKEEHDPKSVTNAVRVTPVNNEFDLTEAQALNLCASLEKAVYTIRDWK